MLKRYYDINENLNEVGIDEAGRGCLFGPVCIASVSLTNFDDPLVNNIKDSKKLSEKKNQTALHCIYWRHREHRHQGEPI